MRKEKQYKRKWYITQFALWFFGATRQCVCGAMYYEHCDYDADFHF